MRHRVLKPPSLPINTKVKGIELQQDEMVSHIYTQLPVNAKVRLPHPWRGDSQDQEMFLATSVDKQTRNYDTESICVHALWSVSNNRANNSKQEKESSTSYHLSPKM